VSTGLVLVGIVVTFLSISAPTSIVESAQGPTFFDGQRAFYAAVDFAGLYPERTIGSAEAQGAAAWLEDRLSTYGISYESDRFSIPFGDASVEITNIQVILPGPSDEAILITSPRNPEPGSGLSAIAGATGTAMLIDLAQVFATRPHDKTIIFLSTEEGGYGGMGITHFLNTYPRSDDITTVISLQGLGYELRDTLQGGTTGPGLASPGWLVELASRVLVDSKLNLRLPNLQEQIADQALRIYKGEQVAGLRAKKAALMIYDEGEGTVRPAGLATQGTAIERLLLSLDQGGRMPGDPGTAMVLSSGRYVTNSVLAILGFLLLAPAVAMAITWLAVTHLSPTAWVRHIGNMLSFVLPLSILPLLVWMAARLGMLPRYQYQAVLMDPAAMRPNWIAVGAIAIVGLILFVISRHLLGYLQPSEPRMMTEIAKLSCALVLLVIGLVLLNSSSPFSMINGLTVAWIWPLSTCFREPRNPALHGWPHLRSNVVLLLTGLLAPLLLYIYLVINTGAGFFTGWWFLLVQMISGAYGISGPAAAVLLLASFMLLLGVKRLEILPMESLEVRDENSLVVLPPPRVRKVARPTGSRESE
jgi:hypothetical protein